MSTSDPELNSPEFISADQDIVGHQCLILKKFREGREAWNAWNAGLRKLFSAEVTELTSDQRIKQKDMRLDFSGMIFGGVEDRISFEGFVFSLPVCFIECSFESKVSFDEAIFKERVKIRNSFFREEATFIGVKFHTWADFGYSFFDEEVSFREAIFKKQVSFDGSTFMSHVKFFNVKFEIKVSFYLTKFYRVPTVLLLSEDDKLAFDFHRAQVRLNRGILQCVSDKYSVRDIERLHLITDSNNSVNESRDLFILLRQAERSQYWRAWWERPWSILKLWKALRKTTLMFLYWMLSNYGRSATLPAVWFVISTFAFYKLYSYMYNGCIKNTEDIAGYTLSSSIPFGKLLNPAFDSAVDRLFKDDVTGQVYIPMIFQLVSVGHGLLGVVLIFLIGLGVRNYFKIS